MENSLQRLIELAKMDGGKFFVIDEKGNPSLVIMSIDAYEQMLLQQIETHQTVIPTEMSSSREYMDDDKRQVLPFGSLDTEPGNEQIRKAAQDVLKSEVIHEGYMQEAPPTENEELDTTFDTLEEL